MLEVQQDCQFPSFEGSNLPGLLANNMLDPDDELNLPLEECANIIANKRMSSSYTQHACIFKCVCMYMLEKAMVPHSSTLAWKIPWTEEPGGLQSMRSLESDTIEQLHFHFSLSCIGEGNGNPLQCSCLENPRDGGAWWAAIYGVAQSRTRLTRLSSSSSSMYMYI